MGREQEKATHLDVEHLSNRPRQRLDRLPNILKRLHCSSTSVVSVLVLTSREKDTLGNAGASDGMGAEEKERGEEGEDLQVTGHWLRREREREERVSAPSTVHFPTTPS